MHRVITTSYLTIAAAMASVAIAQDGIEWRADEGGNGHWYELIAVGNAGISWESASAIARQRNGYLATLTSNAEADWIWTHLASREEAWRIVNNVAGPHIGLFRVDADQPWEWVSGEAFSYSAFGPCNDNAYGTEDRGQFGCLAIEPVWNDVRPKDGNAGGAIVEHSADCNGDGVVDYGQIAEGALVDQDGDGVPDCCETNDLCIPCDADITDDRRVDAADLGVLIALWGTDGGSVRQADIDRNGTIDATDLGALLSAWGNCP